MDTPKLDPGSLTTRLTSLLCSVQRLANGDLLTAINDLDLSVTQLRALFVLDRHGPLPGGEIARELQLTPGATSRVCEALHQLGLVTRSEDRNDRRVRRLALTSAGQGLVEQVSDTRRTAVARAVSLLAPDEQSRLQAALEPLTQRIAALVRAERATRTLGTDGPVVAR
jgi:DNA-binding MarR family transcriptional regulator